MSKRSSLALVLALSAFVSAAHGDGKTGKEKTPPPKFEQGVVVGNKMIGVDSRGHLVTQDLMWGGGRDYGTLDRKLGKYIDVAGDKACVTTPEEVCEVDLASGKVVRSVNHTTGIGGVGFIDTDRVFTHNGQTLEIVDLAAGKILHKIELAEGKRRANWLSGIPLIAHSRSGNRLFIARPFRRDVAVVDLDQGTLVEPIKLSLLPWTTGVHVAGNKLFARQMMVSYGFVTESLAVVDLETGESRRLKFPRHPASSDTQLRRFGSSPSPQEIIPTDNGGFFLAAQQGVYQYSADGNLIGESTQALKNGTRLFAACEGGALVADAKSIRRIQMSPAKIAAE